MEELRFAKTWWCAEDIATYREDNELPQWTTEQCEKFLRSIEDSLMDAMTAAGWDTIAATIYDE